MPRYAQSNAGQIDASGIAGLGNFGQNALGMMLDQQQQDARMNLARRAQAADEAQAWAQNELERKQYEQQAEEQKKQQEAARQGKIMQLAQLSADGESFEKIAQYLLPDLSPLERDFGRTFADETSRVKKEKEKAAKEEKEAARVAGFIPGMVGGIANLPPDQRAQAIAGMGQQANLPPGVLDYTVQSELARKAEKDAAEAAKNARAAMKAGGAGGLNPNQQALQADRLRRTIRLEGAKWDEPMSQATGALKAQEGVTPGDTEGQRLADSAMLYGFARLLSPVGVLSDEDVRRALAQLPGALGSAQTVNRVLSGSGVMTPGERKAMRKALEGRMAAIGETRRKTRGYVEKQAKKFGLDPTDIVDPEGFGDVVSGKGTSTSAPAAPAPPSEAEYRMAKVRARKFLGREPTDTEIAEMLRIKLGQ
jgi:hypothetical protein